MKAKISQLQGVATQAELPLPVGGLNTRESRSSMALTDAVFFQNFVSEPDGVSSRNGYIEFADGLTGDVNYLSEYINGTTKNLLIGAGTVLYDVGTGGGSVNSVKTGFTSTNFESAQLSGSAVLVNGTDQPQIYNGTTSTNAVYTGDLLTDGATNINGISNHKSRLYLWDTDSADFYYGTTNAIQGQFDKFPLNQVSKTGGNLLIVKSISRDGGSGLDDVIAFILDTGEVLIYQGSDPSSASNFALVGRYFIPAPINKRSAIEFAGDVIVLTREDIVSLNQTINSSTDEGAVLLKPSKLSGAIREAFSTYGNNSNWQLSLYNKKGWLIVNVPLTDNSSYQQYVVILSTQASSLFTGWDANQFNSFNNGLYFGFSNKIYQADVGFDDNGEPINGFIQQAFSTLSNSQVKNVKNLTIKYLFDGQISLGAEIAYDYSDRQVNNLAFSRTFGASWDTSEWDTSSWAGNIKTRDVRFSTTGVGVAISTIIQLSIVGAKFRWLGTNVSLVTQRMI